MRGRSLRYCGVGARAADEPLAAWSIRGIAAKRRPMTEWIARQCSGAVVHAEHYFNRVNEACLGRVALIPLAATYPDLPPRAPWWGRLTIATVGHANPNKRIDQILFAIAASPTLRPLCRVRVIGPAAEGERRRLTRLAMTLGVEPPEFTGWVSDESLRWQLRDVDVISCLRSPILEGGSASLILGMLSGRPTAVSGHGCYVDPPADTLMRCTPGREALDLMLHLEHFLKDPQWGWCMADKALAYAQEKLAPSAYTDALLAHLEGSVEGRPVIEAVIAVRAMGEEIGLPWGEPGLTRFENVISELTAIH